MNKTAIKQFWMPRSKQITIWGSVEGRGGKAKLTGTITLYKGIHQDGTV